MNPLGIFQAVIAAVEVVAHAADPKRQRETTKESRRFLFLYPAFIVLGVGIMVWVVRSLYFAR
jgi:hypothetical protein